MKAYSVSIRPSFRVRSSRASSVNARPSIASGSSTSLLEALRMPTWWGSTQPWTPRTVIRGATLANFGGNLACSRLERRRVDHVQEWNHRCTVGNALPAAAVAREDGRDSRSRNSIPVLEAGDRGDALGSMDVLLVQSFPDDFRTGDWNDHVRSGGQLWFVVARGSSISAIRSAGSALSRNSFSSANASAVVTVYSIGVAARGATIASSRSAS